MEDVRKLILLGNGSVGKSSIVQRFTNDGFERIYKQTVGLDFFEKTIQPRDNVSVKLQLWDIGGQSISSDMLDKYIYAANIILLCYDVTDRNSFNDVQDWLRLARKHNNKALIYLVGNKNDLEHLRQVSKKQHKLFILENKLQGGFLGSANENDNIQNIFYNVAANARGIKLDKSQIPINVINIHLQDDPEQESGEDQRYEEHYKAKKSKKSCILM
uniref:Uncharacterized protein n=1 Tax=Mucochytrium quahogii TaxID=96639 RepID=A0A7S2RY27_9STRA|mmetsp:Transcript_20789/g.34400  ORF Transcript_20789/g.34400 Transcript_20789/m.34400 type:complete len:216 (-) Transcript_20789:206-853(-)